MAAAQIDLFGLAERRLAWTEQRQALLAQNIANADTPGWRARDLKPFEASLSNAQVAQVRTDAMHLASSAATSVAMTAARGEHAPDGNAIALDQQLSKVADTESTHQLVIGLYMKYQGLFRMALGR